MKASKRRSKGLTAKRYFEVSYKGQRRVLQRWQPNLKAMRLHARAKGDQRARIALSGIMAPGIELGDGSLWVLTVGLAARMEIRKLSTGQVRRRTKQRKRPEGLYFGTRQGHSVCLLKPRPQLRFFGR